ncbi:MAG: hypothetical protein ACR2J3_11510 [Aridibacter sp.]
MKFTKTFGIFFLTFIVGLFFVFMTQTKYLAVKENHTKPNAPKIEAKKIKSVKEIAVFKPKVSETKPKILNVEKFQKQKDKNVNTKFVHSGEVTNFEDFKIKSGESWFGFFTENGKESIRKTKIKIKKSKENTLDWTDIDTTDLKRPAFLVKSVRGIKNGKVKTVFRGNVQLEDFDYSEETEIKYGFSKKLKLNEVEYVFRTEKRVSENGEDLIVLLLEKDGTSQIITFVYGNEDTPVGNFYWAGDLDNDGKLDFYMDFWGYEKGYYNSGLFISSEAKKGRLVEEFGYFMFGGC